ncbi:MAG: hypothetical protein V3S41_03645 [Spirochaetia bacterium]
MRNRARIHLKYSVDVDGRPCRAVASSLVTEFHEGDEMSLHLPSDRIRSTKE